MYATEREYCCVIVLGRQELHGRTEGTHDLLLWYWLGSAVLLHLSLRSLDRQRRPRSFVNAIYYRKQREYAQQYNIPISSTDREEPSSLVCCGIEEGFPSEDKQHIF